MSNTPPEPLCTREGCKRTRDCAHVECPMRPYPWHDPEVEQMRAMFRELPEDDHD